MSGREFETARDAGTELQDVPELETESLQDVLADIAGGMRTDCHGFWIPDAPC